jgi:hypothetical protein
VEHSMRKSAPCSFHFPPYCFLIVALRSRRCHCMQTAVRSSSVAPPTAMCPCSHVRTLLITHTPSIFLPRSQGSSSQPCAGHAHEGMPDIWAFDWVQTQPLQLQSEVDA